MLKIIQWLMQTSRLLLIVSLLSAFCLFAMWQGSVVSWVVFYTILPFALYSGALFFYPMKGMAVERIVNKSILQYGEKVQVTLSVRRKLRFPLLYTVIEERWEDPLRSEEMEPFKAMVVLGVKNQLEWTYEIEGVTRGEHLLKGLTIEVTDFFGWMKKSVFIAVQDSITVYPKIVDFHLNAVGFQESEGVKRASFQLIKDMTMSSGVRNYQPGDRVSQIHWKSFARTQTLMSKEYETHHTEDYFLYFDCRPSDLFEDQVTIVASLLRNAQRQQIGIDFWATDFNMTPPFPIQSEVQLQKTLLYLAKVSPLENQIKEESLFHARAMLNQKGHMVVVTSSPNWTFLKSIVANVMSGRTIICVVVIKDDGVMTERVRKDIQFARLKGILVYPVAKASISAFRVDKRRASS